MSKGRVPKGPALSVAWPETMASGYFRALSVRTGNPRRNPAIASMTDDPAPAGDPANPGETAIEKRPGLTDRVWIPLLAVALVVLMLAADGWITFP